MQSSDIDTAPTGDEEIQPGPSPSTQSPRASRHVSTIACRKLVILWMLCEAEHAGSSDGVLVAALHQFPEVFRSSYKPNYAKAWRRWRGREEFMANYHNSPGQYASLTSRRVPGIVQRRIHANALAGRGRKRAAWVEVIHGALFTEFQRLGSLGMKFNAHLLRVIPLELLDSDTIPYSSTSVSDGTGTLIKDLITSRWIYSFMSRFCIVPRKLSGSKSRSEYQKNLTERRVTFYLGQLERDFADGTLSQEMCENMNETLFVVNMDNRKTLGIMGDEVVKYVDVVSGGQGMTLVLRLSGGVSSKIETPVIIFQNKNGSYPIAGVPDDVPGVAYRSGPKGWMDQDAFCQWLNERQVLSALGDGHTRVLFLDNCSGHNETQWQKTALSNLNTVARKLPQNSTHLCQPLDSFVIQKIKECWRRIWDSEKYKLLTEQRWASGPSASGKLTNPGKTFFLNLAARVVQEVSAMRDNYGVSYSRKAMIRCGLALDVDGTWNVSQLFPHLQHIVERHPMNFCGLPPEQDE